jgi:hypothetical protein
MTSEPSIVVRRAELTWREHTIRSKKLSKTLRLRGEKEKKKKQIRFREADVRMNTKP